MFDHLLIVHIFLFVVFCFIWRWIDFDSYNLGFPIWTGTTRIRPLTRGTWFAMLSGRTREGLTVNTRPHEGADDQKDANNYDEYCVHN